MRSENAACVPSQDELSADPHYKPLRGEAPFLSGPTRLVCPDAHVVHVIND